MLFYYKNKHLQPNTTSKKCQLKHRWILTARILPVQLPKRAQIPPFESPRTGYTWSTAKDLVMSTRPGPNLCQSPDLSLLRLFGHLQLSHFSRQSQQRNQVKKKDSCFLTSRVSVQCLSNAGQCDRHSGSTGWAGCCLPQAAVESVLEHAGLSDTIKIQEWR